MNIKRDKKRRYSNYNNNKNTFYEWLKTGFLIGLIFITLMLLISLI